MSRNEQHYREMLVSASSVDGRLAASAVYATRHGAWSQEDSNNDEWRDLVRDFQRDHGDSVPIDVVLSAMDAAQRAARYGKLVRGWDWRTTPELLEDAEALAARLGMSKTQLLEHAIRLLLKAE